MVRIRAWSANQSHPIQMLCKLGSFDGFGDGAGSVRRAGFRCEVYEPWVYGATASEHCGLWLFEIHAGLLTVYV
jgi:hypothetical protein